MISSKTIHCRAKDPAHCSYHVKTTIEQSRSALLEERSQAARAKDMNRYLEISDILKEQEKETKAKKAEAWTDREKTVAAATLAEGLLMTGADSDNIYADEHAVEGSDKIKALSDSLEDESVEVELTYVDSDSEVITELHIPILNVSVLNSNTDEEIRHGIPSEKFVLPSYHNPPRYNPDGTVTYPKPAPVYPPSSPEKPGEPTYAGYHQFRDVEAEEDINNYHNPPIHHPDGTVTYPKPAPVYPPSSPTPVAESSDKPPYAGYHEGTDLD